MSSKKEIRRSLFEAVSENNLERVKEIANLYGLSYCQDWSGGYVLLCNATKFGRDEIAKFLVQKGANVNSKKSAVDSPLHFAAKKGSVELVEMLISKYASVDALNESQETPLFNATERGCAEIVKLLLNAGASCCSTNKAGSEPLLLACSQGYVETAKLLLDFRARKKFLSLEPLHLALVLASNKGSEELVSFLLDAGANPNAVFGSNIVSRWKYSLGGNSCFSPLLLACQKGHEGVFKILLKHGAHLDCSRYEDNYKALHLASEFGRAEIVAHLLRLGVDPNMEANDKATPLHLAAKARFLRRSEVIQLLLSNGANINAQTNEGSTPLLLAVKFNCEETVKILLEHGASVNLRDKDSKTPLQSSIDSRSSCLVNLLLQYNPDIDGKIKKSIISAVFDYYHHKFVDNVIEYGCFLNREDISENPKLLSTAVEKGYTKVVESILNCGVDQKDRIHDPILLHVAVKNGHPEIIKLLLKSGYDINAADIKGNTPICYIMNSREKSKWIEIFQILSTNGAVLEKASEFLREAVDKESFEMCKVLIENCGADVNMGDRYGKTPLHMVVLKGGLFLSLQLGKLDETISVEIVKLLLSNKANVHAETQDGMTALHFAASVGKKEVTRILLNFGAEVNSRVKRANYRSRMDVNKPLENGPTALHLAAQEGHAEVVKVLVEFDADTDSRAEEKRTALQCAIKADRENVVKVLLENGCDINVENEKGQTVLDLSLQVAESSYTYDYSYYDDEYYDSDEDDPNYIQVRIKPEDHVVSNMLKMHVVKLRVAGLHVGEKILQQVNLNPRLVDYQKLSEEELRKLKNEKLCCHLTLFNILMDLKNPAYLKNEVLKETLESLNFDNYPIYGSLIKNGIEKNKQKLALLITGKESLDVLLKTSSVLNGEELLTLLDEVLEKILSYLRISELKNLILSGEAIKNQVFKQ